MSKLLEFGRKVLFYNTLGFFLAMKNIESVIIDCSSRGVFNSASQAQERKLALRKIPEQTILAEVRCMVEEMQNLNWKLEETEAAIEKYFKPIDKEAEIVMKMQLEGEEKTTREMMKTMQTQALLEKAEAEKVTNAHHVDAKPTYPTERIHLLAASTD